MCIEKQDSPKSLKNQLEIDSFESKDDHPEI
jgi:hypothetical protein